MVAEPVSAPRGSLAPTPDICDYSLANSLQLDPPNPAESTKQGSLMSSNRVRSVETIRPKNRHSSAHGARN